MILSDGTLRKLLASGELVVEPVEDSQIQPSTIDFRLGADMLVFQNHTVTAIDPFNLPANLHTKVLMDADHPFILHPGEFVLGTSLERVEIPDHIVGHCDGKSSLGRCGLQIHSTAGLLDSGFKGQVTLELSNVSTFPIILTAGMKIGQFSFEFMDAPAERPYGHPDLNSKYQNQVGTTGSQYSRNTRPTQAEPQLSGLR
ncbi:dCTP deaminase [Tessaracoccus sp.]